MTKNNYSVILCCSCFGMEKRAKEAFGLLTHGQEELPDIVKGRDRIYKFAKTTGNDHILAISKLSGKYAYCVKLSEDNTILEEHNLLTGARIK